MQLRRFMDLMERNTTHSILQTPIQPTRMLG